ncbi:MAG: hypothetical protein Q8S18_10495 [Bacteroidales bacterium]|nr:hypothetical protein [Bacteroidales bacterium]
MRKTIIILIVTLAGCTFFGGHDDLSIQKTNYNGNSLRINGYYYDEGFDYNNILIFYQNGVLLSLICDVSEIDKLKETVNTKSFFNPKTSFRFDWGLFRIVDDSIYYEEWAAYDGYKPAFLHTGYILNDTTFVITSVSSHSKIFDKPKYTQTNTLYRFRQLHCKPDSTNKYIN